jgi:hypothetical protein
LNSLSEQLGIQDAKDGAESYAEILQSSGEDIGTIGNQFKIAGNFASNLGKNLLSSFSPLDLAVTALGFIIDAMVSADKRAGELAKNFGISYDAARGMSSELNDVANSSYLLNITTQGLTETFTEINNRYGTFAAISDGNLETFSDLKELAGLTSETIGTISDLSLLTGENAEDITKEFLGQTAALNNQYGIALNEKQILEGISKTSAATLLTFNSQGKSLAEAIFKATALGMSLAEVENIASSLLDFESSISNELSAELITGKQINLEKAREAALTNDLSTVTEEISKNIGSAAEFGKMNVIQQEALAKAVGMNREDLAKSLKTQEELENLGTSMNEVQEKFNKALEEGKSIEEARAIAGDNSYTNMLASQTVGERFQATMEKLKEAFTPLGEALLPVVDAFAEIFKIVGPIVGFMGQIVKYTIDFGKYLLPVYGTYLGIKIIQASSLAVQQAQLMLRIRAKGTEQAIGMEKRLQALLDNKSLAHKIVYNAYLTKDFVMEKGKFLFKQLQLGLEKVSLGMKKLSVFLGKKDLIKSIGTAAMNVISSLSKIPVIGWALGLAAAGSTIALGYQFMKGDDVVSEGGYGKRTLMAPEGAIALNDKDTIIAGTNLFPNEDKLIKGESSSIPPSITVNMQPLVDKLMSIENVLTQILNKGSNISIDSTRLGTAMSISSAKIQ